MISRVLDVAAAVIFFGFLGMVVVAVLQTGWKGWALVLFIAAVLRLVYSVVRS